MRRVPVGGEPRRRLPAGAIVIALIALMVWGPSSASGGGRESVRPAHHAAGVTACLKGARGRACRQRRRAKRQRPDAAVPPAPAPAPPPAEVPLALPPSRPGPVDASGCPGADLVSGAGNPRAVDAAVACLVNAAREAEGLARLRPAAELAAAARGHAEDMVARRYFGHDTPEGVGGFERAQAAGYRGARYSQVIAVGPAPVGTARFIVGAWLDSDPHRAVLLSPLYRDAGVAVASGTPGGAPGGTFVMDLGDR
jgi:uncharacterized protein YkwD